METFMCNIVHLSKKKIGSAWILMFLQTKQVAKAITLNYALAECLKVDWKLNKALNSQQKGFQKCSLFNNLFNNQDFFGLKVYNCFCYISFWSSWLDEDLCLPIHLSESSTVQTGHQFGGSSPSWSKSLSPGDRRTWANDAAKYIQNFSIIGGIMDVSGYLLALFIIFCLYFKHNLKDVFVFYLFDH